MAGKTAVSKSIIDRVGPAGSPMNLSAVSTSPAAVAMMKVKKAATSTVTVIIYEAGKDPTPPPNAEIVYQGNASVDYTAHGQKDHADEEMLIYKTPGPAI